LALCICFFYGAGPFETRAANGDADDDDDDGLSKRSKSIYPPGHQMGVRMAEKRTRNGQSWKGVNGNNKTRNAKFPSAARKLFYDAFKLIFWKNNVKTDFLFAVAAAVGENCWLSPRGHVKILFYLPSLRAHFEVERVAVASCEFRIRNSELEMQVTGESWPSFCALPIVCSHELVIKLAQRPSSHLLASRRTANGNLLLLSQLHRRHFPFCPVSRGHQSKLRHKIFSLSRTFVK